MCLNAMLIRMHKRRGMTAGYLVGYAKVIVCLLHVRRGIVNGVSVDARRFDGVLAMLLLLDVHHVIVNEFVSAATKRRISAHAHGRIRVLAYLIEAKTGALGERPVQTRLGAVVVLRKLVA